MEGCLREALRTAQDEVVQQGVALRLGVTGMRGKIPEVFTDLAAAGEEAGYTMGLVLLGTADAASVDEMLTYAQETA